MWMGVKSWGEGRESGLTPVVLSWLLFRTPTLDSGTTRFRLVSRSITVKLATGGV